ncbi:MAG: hypothetical protein ACMUHU_06710 [Thermoplasmatota archaeon]
MNDYKPKYLVFGLAILFLLSSFVVMIGAGDGEENASEIPTRATQYSSAYASGLNSHYIGSNVQFRLTVNNIYSGEEWKGDPYSYLHDDLYYVKLSILADKVTNADGKIQANLVNPMEPGSLNPYNGPDGKGYNISSSRTYYNNEDNDYFAMYIKAQGIKEGYYTLPVQISGRIQIDYSATDPSGYVWYTFNEQVEITFFVSSYVSGASDDMTISGYESGYCPIYAGSKYLTFIGTSISPQGPALDGFEMELTIPPEYFYMDNSIIKVSSFSYARTPMWKVDISEFTPPGNYVGYVNFKYNVGELFIYDGPYNITLTVAPTPLLIGPDTKDMTIPTFTITQKTTEETVTVQFTNSGNVPLLSAKVRLDLDSSMFLQQKYFYYDEDNYARKVYPPLEFMTDEVGIGETFTAAFPAVSIARMLPPGDYLVPFDYEAIYIDPSDDTGMGIRLTSYQYDEMGIEEYMDIMWFRSDPRKTDLKRPHIMIRVMDDDDMPEYELEMEDVLKTGDSGRYIHFVLRNMEFYDITDASVQIWSSDPSLVWNPNSPSDPALLAEVTGARIEGSDFYSYGEISLYSRVDVSKEAGSGLFEIYTTLSGSNDQLEMVAGNRSSFVQIKAEPGRLDVASISTSSVKPGKDFKLTLTLINNGDVSVQDYQIMVSCHDNMISVEQPMISGSVVGPGQTVTIEFSCHASDCMDYEMSSGVYVLTKLNDAEGNQVDFSDGDGSMLNIMAAREPEELHTTNAVRDTARYFFLAVLFAAIILSLTVLGSIFLFIKAKYGGILKPKERTPPEEKPKRMEKKEETVEKDEPSKPEAPVQRPSQTPAPSPPVQQPPAQQPAPIQQTQTEFMKAPPANTGNIQQSPQQQMLPSQKPMDPDDELKGVFDSGSKVDDLFT